MTDLVIFGQIFDIFCQTIQIQGKKNNKTFYRVPVNKELLTGTIPFNQELLTGMVPINNLIHKIFLLPEFKRRLKETPPFKALLFTAARFMRDHKLMIVHTAQTK